jgi:hypothetical protein
MNTRTATASDWLRDMALDYTPTNPRVDAARLGAAALDLVQRYVREVADAPDEAITGALVDAYWAELRALAAKASQPIGHR